MAIGADLALPQVQAPRPLSSGLVNAYIHRLLTAAEHDPVVAARFLRVSAFLEKPPRLMTPAMLVRVFAGSRRPRTAAVVATRDAIAWARPSPNWCSPTGHSCWPSSTPS